MSTNTNNELSHIFTQMATALDLIGANKFKINANIKVARTLKDLTRDIAGLVDLAKTQGVDPVKELTEIDGIGKGSAEKIVEYLDTGVIAEHQELLAQIPAGLFEVLEVPGLGPKTVKLMWDQLNITCLADLQTQLDSEELAALPRMGKKTIDNIRQAIDFTQKSAGRVPIGLALPIAQGIVANLKPIKGIKRIDYAGSLRRGRETIGDIDILVSCKDAEIVREAFCNHLQETVQVLARGDTKCSIRLDFNGLVIQADLRIVPDDSYGAALGYFTGSKEHNVRLREIAIKQDMRLNEYGLYKGTEERPQDSGVKPLVCKTEQDIYAGLGLVWVPPEIREDKGECALAVKEGGLPVLIELSDIRSDLHTHTDASDGKQTLEQLIEFAKARGYHTVAVTDHSVSSVIANGLDGDRLRRHIDLIHEANENVKGITVLAGSEVDILSDGSLDYDDDLLAKLDIVVASPHIALRQDRATATKRLLAAVTHPLVHIIGHPTGRIINKREGLSLDMATLFAAAAEHNTALEINANWNRLDLQDNFVRMAVEDYDCLISINTDAHTEAHFDYMQYGVLTGRRGWLTAKSCINTWTANKLHKWLKSKR